jgi:hypothetical protein
MCNYTRHSCGTIPRNPMDTLMEPTGHYPWYPCYPNQVPYGTLWHPCESLLRISVVLLYIYVSDHFMDLLWYPYPRPVLHTYITLMLYPYLASFGHETDIFMTLHPGILLALPGILVAVPGILVSLPDILVALPGIFPCDITVSPTSARFRELVPYIPACDYNGNRPSNPIYVRIRRKFCDV